MSNYCSGQVEGSLEFESPCIFVLLDWAHDSLLIRFAEIKVTVLTLFLLVFTASCCHDLSMTTHEKDKPAHKSREPSPY